MKFLGYILTYSALWVIARLPVRCMYVISDFLYLILCYVAGYRKKVVQGNLRKAFPEYSNQEINSVVRKFYRHFSDLILESAIIHFISYERASKQFSFKNPEMLVDLYNKGLHVIGIGGHYANWEFLSHLERIFNYKAVAIYKPLNNKYFDRIVRRTRGQYGSIIVPMSGVGRTIMQLKRDNILAFTGFLADQRPVWQHIQYWTKFMGVDSPVYLGPEKLAMKLDAAVIFLNIRKIRRGYYETEFVLITEHAKKEKPFAITEAHIKLLEELIKEEPAYWLWSHNRWKFNRDDFEREHPNFKNGK